MDESFLAGNSSIWVLPDGPNSQPKYLGCHGIGDITEPRGDITVKYCPDPARSGAYKATRSFRGEPGSVTTSIETVLTKTADYLELIGECEFPIFVHKVSCGRRDVFSNFDRTFILRGAQISQSSLGQMASRSPDNEDESTQTFDVSAHALVRIFHMTTLRAAISETEDITGVAVCGEDRCEGDCGASMKVTDKMYAAAKAHTGSVPASANVLASLNGGAWAATATDPFEVGEDIQGIACVQMGRDETRIIVGRGTTDASNPAEVAVSDDNGTTWQNYDVGTVDGEYIVNGHALFAMDRYHIWVGTSGGRIYFSEDAGVNWTLQEPAIVSATNIVGVSFANPKVGFAVYTGGEIAKTIDGGDTWGAVTGSGSADATDIHAISPYFVWVSGTDGKFYTHDGGTTWSTRDSISTGAIDFLDELVGYAVGPGASAPMYTTINGGFDWSLLPSVSNAGFNDVVVISPQLAYAAGNAESGTGMLVKIQPQV
jgi:hypothetical protein